MPARPRTISALLSVSALSLGLAACNDGHSEAVKKEPERRAVLVAPIHLAKPDRTRTLVASIRPRVEVDLGFRVAGKVARRFVDPGQSVKAGDVVALLDETDLRLQMEQAAAEVAAARVSFAQASADARRGLELNRAGWTPQSTIDKLKSAEQEASGRLARSERSLELAQNALTYATLRATNDGVVTAALIEPGQVVSAGQPAIRIARLEEKEALVAIPEPLVGRLQSLTARVKLWSGVEKTYSAKLREITPMADASTRTYAARFSIPDADGEVALGMSATILLSEDESTPVAQIPLTALFDQGFGPAVWTVNKEGGLALKKVRVARYETKTAIVDEGLAEGDSIVVLGVQKLDPQQQVRPITRLGN